MKKYDNTSAINALKRTQKKYQIDFERFEVSEQTARNNKELIAEEILCVNPDHLFLGTYLDNSNDKVAKGRQHKKTHCSRGHLLEDPNLYHCSRDNKPYRLCKACVKIRR